MTPKKATIISGILTAGLAYSINAFAICYDATTCDSKAKTLIKAATKLKACNSEKEQVYNTAIKAYLNVQDLTALRDCIDQAKLADAKLKKQLKRIEGYKKAMNVSVK